MQSDEHIEGKWESDLIVKVDLIGFTEHHYFVYCWSIRSSQIGRYKNTAGTEIAYPNILYNCAVLDYFQLQEKVGGGKNDKYSVAGKQQSYVLWVEI